MKLDDKEQAIFNVELLPHGWRQDKDGFGFIDPEGKESDFVSFRTALETQRARNRSGKK